MLHRTLVSVRIGHIVVGRPDGMLHKEISKSFGSGVVLTRELEVISVLLHFFG